MRSARIELSEDQFAKILQARSNTQENDKVK